MDLNFNAAKPAPKPAPKPTPKPADNSDFIAGILAGPVLATLTVAVPTVLTLPRALALMLLWQWYAVAVFALPPMGLWTAFGFVLMAGVLTYRKPSETSRGIWRSIGDQLFFLGVVLVAGWFGSLFV